MEMWYWDERAEIDWELMTMPPVSGNVTARFVNSWDNWPPVAIVTGEADDDPFRRLAAQIRGPGERLATEVLQR